VKGVIKLTFCDRVYAKTEACRVGLTIEKTIEKTVKAMETLGNTLSSESKLNHEDHNLITFPIM
jgi:hypothetical protein